MDNVKLSGYLLRDHELVVNNVHITAESKKKRKRIINYEALKIPHAAVQDLQESLKCISKNLQSWPYSAEAALFMRAPKNTDFNVLDKTIRVKCQRSQRNGSDINHHCSQHTQLGAQLPVSSVDTSPTLIANPPRPVRLPHMRILRNPEEIVEDGEVFGYSQINNADNKPCVMCIEGLAYGDGQSDPDYAECVDRLDARGEATKDHESRLHPRHDQAGLIITPNRRTVLYAPPRQLRALHCRRPNQAIASTLHQCTEILTSSHRLRRPTDLLSDFPITTHITPVLLDLCRGCCKVPAVYAIVGDVRLPESPCVMCEPCWTNMGPSDDSDVSVAPLPRRVHGWER
ncbi:snRNA-activating protein of MW terminal-domain-containing [Salix suchowensis]|nr:snRNA-activating protein of MW terminal-domain-containing [Salix suchowensis]